MPSITPVSVPQRGIPKGGSRKGDPERGVRRKKTTSNFEVTQKCDFVIRSPFADPPLEDSIPGLFALADCAIALRCDSHVQDPSLKNETLKTSAGLTYGGSETGWGYDEMT